MTRIILVGCAGQRNLGDDALVQVFAEQLQGADLVAVSSNPEETTAVTGLPAFYPYGLRQIGTKVRTLLRCEAIVFAGGSPLKEIREGVTDRSRFQLLLGTLALVWLGRLLRKQVVFAHVGVGPLRSKLARALCRWAIQGADRVIVRDSHSMDVLQNIGGRSQVTLAADATWALSWRPAPHRHGSGVPRIGLAPHYYVQGAHIDYATFRDEMVNLCTSIHRQLNGVCEIHLLAFCYGYYDHDDIAVCQEIARLLPREIAACIDVEATPEAMLDRIASLDMVVGVRLHASIFACITGVSLLPVVYDVKCRGFAHDAGLSDWAVEIEDVAAGRLPEHFARAWRDRVQIGRRIAHIRPSMVDRALTGFDEVRTVLARPSANRRRSSEAMRADR